MAEDVADEMDSRPAEEVLLATIDATADDKLTRFAIRLALSGHAGIPRDSESDFLTEAETVFLLHRQKEKDAEEQERSASKANGLTEEEDGEEADRGLNPERESAYRLPLTFRQGGRRCFSSATN